MIEPLCHETFRGFLQYIPRQKRKTPQISRNYQPTATTFYSKILYSSTFPKILKMAANYAVERKIAELAVRRASILTNKTFHSLVKGTVSKEDKSPVTSTVP